MEELETGQKLYRLEQAQNDDGTINLTIEEWEENDNKVNITLSDALGEEKTKTCDLPRSRDEDNFFNDILDYTGWEFSTAENNLEGEKIPAKYDDGIYHILPEKKSRRQRFVEWFGNVDKIVLVVQIILFPILFIPVGIITIDGSTEFKEEIRDFAKGYAVAGFAAFLWFTFIMFFIL